MWVENHAKKSQKNGEIGQLLGATERANCVNNVKLFCAFLEIPIDSTFSPKKDIKIVVLNQFFKLERLRILSREKTVENCRFLFFQDGVLVMVSKVQLTTLLFSLDYTN